MKKKIEIIGLNMGFFAVIAQFVLMIQNRQVDIPESIIRFFSFFTILTNIIVALYLMASVFKLNRFPFKFLLAKGSLTAITAFILIVGSVYQIALRQIWNPTGLQYIVDELLHTIIPLFMLGYWFFYVKKEDLQLKNVLKWLLYPLVYMAFILFRGKISGYYPYPFLNITEIGTETALLNIAIIFVLNIAILGALSFFGKYRVKNEVLQEDNN